MAGSDCELQIMTEALMVFRARRSAEPHKSVWRIIDEMCADLGWSRAKYGDPFHPHFADYNERRDMFKEVGKHNDMYLTIKVPVK